jgi:hypothetical protein
VLFSIRCQEEDLAVSLLDRPGFLRAQRLEELELAPSIGVPELVRIDTEKPSAEERVRLLLGRRAFPLAFYTATRAVLLLIAGVAAILEHKSLSAVFGVFDGGWYLRLATHGYPTEALHVKSTLGFFPAYPMVMRTISYLTGSSFVVAGLAASFVGGAVATLLVGRLASSWWGEATGRRAVVVFCLFPGSVVFSLVYSECLTVSLVLGCLICLKDKRWWLAGALAGIATAVAPVALVLIPVCGLAALSELRAKGLKDPLARRSLVAPLLAPVGVGAFALFLWAWTGTPFAALAAQHYGWYQQSEPLGVAGLPIVHHLVTHPADIVKYLGSWNLWNGIFGALFLLVSLVALYRRRHELSPGALALTFGIGLVTLWSVMTPPNARMILIATPAVLIWARKMSGRGFFFFVVSEAALFLFLSALTLSGHMLP